MVLEILARAMYIATMFTIARHGNNLRVYTQIMDKENVTLSLSHTHTHTHTHTHVGTLFSLFKKEGNKKKKKGNPSFCDQHERT